MARLVADFWDEASGTVYDTGPEHEQSVARPRSLLDGATPGANAVAADVWLRLALLTGEPDHDRRARRILAAAGPLVERQPSAFGRMLCAADRACVPRSTWSWPATRPTRGPWRSDGRQQRPTNRISSSHRSRRGTTSASDRCSSARPRVTGSRRPMSPGYACDAPTTDPGTVSEQVARLAVLA